MKLNAAQFKTTRSGVILLLLVLLTAPLFSNAFQLHVMIMMSINIMMAVSMWLLSMTGLTSFGQAGFMFIGAMTSTLLVKNLGWPFWICIPLAGIVPALVCVPIGRLCIRVKGVYFFIVTLAFGFVVNGVFAYFRNPFGGWYGILHIPPPEPHSLFTPLNKVPFYYLALVLTVITCWVIHRISSSRIGMTFWSIDKSDLLAESVGINVIKYKLLAFVVAAFFAGIAGTYYAHYFSYISPLVFSFNMSFYTLIYIIVGGALSFSGPIVGAAVLTLIPEFFRATGVYQMLIFGVILVLSMLFMPQGIVGLLEGKVIPRLRRVRAKHVGHSVAS
jgi:branched-chain amino acid transport system permease protein